MDKYEVVGCSIIWDRSSLVFDFILICSSNIILSWVSVKRRSSQGLGQRHPKEDANRREYDVVHDSLWRLPGEMYPLPADAVGAVEVQFHIE